MTKKEYLLMLLEKIGPKVFPIHKDLFFLIEHNAINNQLIDIFFEMFHEIAKEAKTDEEKNLLQKGLNFLDHIKQIESQEIIKDQKDLETLDKLLTDM